MIDTRTMTCTKCGKRLTRKSARMIDGKLLCAPCMFGQNNDLRAIAAVAAPSPLGKPEPQASRPFGRVSTIAKGGNQ